MKRGFIFLLIILLITENVNAYSFSDFVNDVRNVREYIYDFITGQPVVGGEPEGQPDPESGATGAGDYVLGVEVVYAEDVAVASSQFTVEEGVKVGKEETIMVALTLFVILVFVAMFIVAKRSRRVIGYLYRRRR